MIGHPSGGRVIARGAEVEWFGLERARTVVRLDFAHARRCASGEKRMAAEGSQWYMAPEIFKHGESAAQDLGAFSIMVIRTLKIQGFGGPLDLKRQGCEAGQVIRPPAIAPGG